MLGALPALPAWRGYGKNSAGKGVTSPALPAWSLWEEFYLLLGPCRLCRLGGGGCGKNTAGKEWARRLCRLGWGYGDYALVKGCPRRLCRLREPFRLPRGPCKINKDTQGIRGLRPLNSYNGCPYVSTLTTGSRYTNFASLARCKFLEYLYLSCGK